MFNKMTYFLVVMVWYILAIHTKNSEQLECLECLSVFESGCNVSSAGSSKCKFKDDECITASGYQTPEGSKSSEPFFFRSCFTCDDLKKTIKDFSGTVYSCNSCKEDKCNKDDFKAMKNETEIEEKLLEQAGKEGC